MSCTLTEEKCDVWEDSSPFLMAYVLLNDGTVAQQADITSISYTVVDRSDDSLVASGSLTVSDVIFDTVQTDSRWTKAIGYNLGFALPAADLPNGDRIYEVDVDVNPVLGDNFPGGRWLLRSKRRRTS